MNLYAGGCSRIRWAVRDDGRPVSKGANLHPLPWAEQRLLRGDGAATSGCQVRPFLQDGCVGDRNYLGPPPIDGITMGEPVERVSLVIATVPPVLSIISSVEKTAQ